MPILTSPSVVITEKDYSQVIPFGNTGEGAIAGAFSMGPINQPILISGEGQLEEIFGRPDDDNYKEWFTAWNFLQYSGKLWVTRIEPTGILNAASSAGISILNEDDYSQKTALEMSTAGRWVAKQPGANGNSLKVMMFDYAAWALLLDDKAKADTFAVTDASWTLGVVTVELGDHPFATGDVITVAGVTPSAYNGSFTITAVTSTEVKFAMVADPTTYTSGGTVKGVSLFKSESRHLSDYARTGSPNTSEFMTVNGGNATANDEIHVFVIDTTGAISGVAGRILELWEGLSKASNANDYLGRNIYYANFMNVYSSFVYWGSAPTITGATGTVVWGASSATASTGSFKELQAIDSVQLANGVNGSFATPSVKGAALNTAYAQYKNKETYNVSYLMTVDYPVAVQQYVVDSVAEFRKDAIAFLSAHDEGTPFLNKVTLVTDLLNYRNNLLNVNSSYAVLDSGYKYQYDGYNQKYRWIPLNGDVAGLTARLDAEAEPWFSPGGFTRGQIKNSLKLSSNLSQADRDQLYPKQVNAVVSFPGKGTVLFGDRTMQAKTSAFQSIHIRKLFIIMEKAIQDAAQYQLFELNNGSTRARFIGMIEPFLKSVQARDGLSDFKIVCDLSNNTDDTIARGEFVADIYVKPIYSIQYVILNFVATKSSVQFNQIIQG